MAACSIILCLLRRVRMWKNARTCCFDIGLSVPLFLVPGEYLICQHCTQHCTFATNNYVAAAHFFGSVVNITQLVVNNTDFLYIDPV